MYLDLVTPAGKVSEGLDGHAYVCLEGQGVHGSRVDGLDGGQLLLVFLHQVCKPGGRGGVSEITVMFKQIVKSFCSLIYYIRYTPLSS